MTIHAREYFRPRIQGGWDSEKGMYAVTLETICPDADIRYTLDGSGTYGRIGISIKVRFI